MEMSSLTKNPALISMDKKPSIDMAKVEESARDFEAMFVSEMMKPMFEGLETDGMFGGGKTEEVFRGFMLEEYGKRVAETGQLGIADAVKAEMIAMQEKANAGNVAQNVHGNMDKAVPMAAGE